MQTVSLGPEASAVISLDVNGNGTAQVGPLSSRETWTPVNVHVSVSSADSESTCNIYVGNDKSQSNFRDATFTGSSGDASDRINADIIKCGTYVFAVWTGGDPFAQAIMTVTGTKTV